MGAHRAADRCADNASVRGADRGPDRGANHGPDRGTDRGPDSGTSCDNNTHQQHELHELHFRDEHHHLVVDRTCAVRLGIYAKRRHHHRSASRPNDQWAVQTWPSPLSPHRTSDHFFSDGLHLFLRGRVAWGIQEFFSDRREA